jgi:hypothetical protein
VPFQQIFLDVIADGAGAALVTWTDGRTSSNDAYVQRLLSTGAADPSWPTDGLLVAQAGDPIHQPKLVSDGSGGAIIAFAIQDPTEPVFVVKHVLPSGSLDPGWPSNGVALCSNCELYDADAYGSGGRRDGIEIVSNGSGGAIVAWMEGPPSSRTLRVQRILSTGAVDPSWPTTGVLVSTSVQAMRLLTDESGGAVIVWTGAPSGVRAQRIDASGALVWGASGVQLSTNGQSPSIASGGSGRVIVTWSSGDILAQCLLLASGAPAAGWPAPGVGVCTVAGIQDAPEITSDGAGGALITWHDRRLPSINPDGYRDIFVHHVLANGTMDPSWPSHPFWPGQGKPLCDVPGEQTYPEIVSDGAGGGVVTWRGSIGGSLVNATGTTVSVGPLEPPSFAVGSPYPNPATLGSAITFALVTPQRVSVGIYDVAGQRIRTLAEARDFPAGNHRLIWDGTDDRGRRAKAGVYFFRVASAGARAIRKTIVLP